MNTKQLWRKIRAAHKAGRTQLLISESEYRDINYLFGMERYEDEPSAMAHAVAFLPPYIRLSEKTETNQIEGFLIAPEYFSHQILPQNLFPLVRKARRAGWQWICKKWRKQGYKPMNTKQLYDHFEKRKYIHEEVTPEPV